MTAAVADPLLLLASGLAVDAWVGDMPRLFTRVPHPIALAGQGIAFFDRKLNRDIRSEATRRVRGAITVIVLVGLVAFMSAILSKGSNCSRVITRLHGPLSGFWLPHKPWMVMTTSPGPTPTW